LGSSPKARSGSNNQTDGPVLLRHDSEFSVGSNYDDGSPNNLNVFQGAALLTADCLGTGILALPGDIQLLGYAVGLGFLIANLPINLYAGTIFHYTATAVETRQKVENRIYHETCESIAAMSQDDKQQYVNYKDINASTVNSEITLDQGVGNDNDDDDDANVSTSLLSKLMGKNKKKKQTDYRTINADTIQSRDTIQSNVTGISVVTTGHQQLHHDTATFDFIGMARALFKEKRATKFVMMIYYINIFLVLGNYILVMSHAVSAIFGDTLSYPQAGLIASTGMFLVSQSRTMARLGRTASILSLTALFIVVVQCLWAAQVSKASGGFDFSKSNSTTTSSPETSVLRKLSALGSIGFAVGSQKLFLNIRHELADRSVAPKCLAYSLSVFGTFYVLIVLAAGPNPPSFLFDAIPPGLNRRIAGFLLWAHVVVSYAINSQAICSSMDRLVWHRLNLPNVFQTPARRWMSLTGVMAIAAYTVANAIPFFKDLVALIGAMTSVPLTLLLPALFWRKHLHVPLWTPTKDSIWSYALTVFSVIFLVTATIGSLYSIQQDWSHEGAPQSNHERT